MPGPNRTRRRLGGGSGPVLAAHFVAANTQFLSIPDNTDLSMGAGVDCTFAGWVRPAVTPTGNRNVFSKANASGTNIEYGAYLKLAGSNLTFFATNNGSTYVEKVNLAVTLAGGTWYFLCCQYDQTNLKISVNNGAFQTIALATGIFDGANRFTFGSNDAGDACWDGDLDSWGIWKSAAGAGGVLTAAQITTLYNNGLALPLRKLSGDLRANLIAWWDFNGVFADGKGANHLANNSGVSFVPGLA